MTISLRKVYALSQEQIIHNTFLCGNCKASFFYNFFTSTTNATGKRVSRTAVFPLAFIALLIISLYTSTISNLLFLYVCFSSFLQALHIFYFTTYFVFSNVNWLQFISSYLYTQLTSNNLCSFMSWTAIITSRLNFSYLMSKVSRSCVLSDILSTKARQPLHIFL